MNTHIFLTKRKTKQFQQPPPSQFACITPLKASQKPIFAANFSTFKEDSSFKSIDSIDVDYRQKCFEFMKKNTQLQLTIKQSKNDIENLEKQVQNFKEIVIEFSKIFNNEQTPNNFNQSMNCEKILQIKNSLSNFIKRQQPKLQPSINQRTSSHISLPQSICQISTSQSRGIFNSTKPEQSDQNCECENHYSQIINQYKSIIEMQHTNIQKKQKSNKLLKKEVQNYKQIFSDVKKNNEKNQQNIAELEEQVNQSREQNQELRNVVEQFVDKEKKSTEKMKELEDKIGEKQADIQKLGASNQELYREKEKIKAKYKQEIVHFQEMEKLVEEKLIEVQYQMNFYKKQRVQNFAKIRKLQSELKQYKINEQKKYYSFGESHKDVSIQTSLSHILDESQAQIIISMDKTVTIKEVEPKKILKKSSIDQELPEEKVSKVEQPENFQMKCYEQSIKTLLMENDRLKKSLIQVYKSKKFPDFEIDENVQMQLKILLSLGQEPEKQQLIEEDPKKDRKFIKQI